MFAEGRGRYDFAPLNGVSAATVVAEIQKVVARDGIEPPTPAFSGPRSTTELPGLSRDVKLHCSARIPALPGKVG